MFSSGLNRCTATARASPLAKNNAVDVAQCDNILKATCGTTSPACDTEGHTLVNQTGSTVISINTRSHSQHFADFTVILTPYYTGTLTVHRCHFRSIFKLRVVSCLRSEPSTMRSVWL